MGRKRFKVATEPIFNYWRLMHRTGCRRQDLRLPVVSRNPHRRARRRSRWTRGTLAHKSGPVVVDAVVDPWRSRYQAFITPLQVRDPRPPIVRSTFPAILTFHCLSSNSDRGRARLQRPHVPENERLRWIND